MKRQDRAILSRRSAAKAKFPEWIFSPGVAPVLADGIVYAGIVIVGHAVMRLVAGPSGEDRFARGTGSAAATQPRTG